MMGLHHMIRRRLAHGAGSLARGVGRAERRSAQAEQRSTLPTTATDRETLQGKLIVVRGSQPTLKTAKRDYTLSAKNSYLSRTLRDERLLNREIRVEGTLKSDGTFEADHLFTVRDGKLYKVRYYCDICNIAAMEPGNCVCCQRPTELQEIPLSEVGNDAVVVP